MGTLYLVATPIGNLEDITLRALRILKQVALIAAEDTRRTKILLDHYQIKTPMTSYFEHNKLTKLPRIMQALQEGDVALVSEAGMPGISDPGYELVKAALDAGYAVVPLPGPSAVTAALAASGLPTDSFLFLGFLPRKKGERRQVLQSVVAESHTLVAFEAPHRIVESLGDIVDILGDRKIALAREVTKIHEEIQRGTVSKILAYFQRTEPRGEFTIILAGAEPQAWDAERIRHRIIQLQEEGVAGGEAVRQVSRLAGKSRNEIYKIWLSIKQGNRKEKSDRPR
ncbi:MAG: 16S rRNA (cytidine(1402)-2'-O)-methyltransferase [Chloroflexi bacterium]|nr:16S rRNA (cytidine(1402)-2'-O)-methyltransferase [Chloroflexota bacterium]